MSRNDEVLHPERSIDQVFMSRLCSIRRIARALGASGLSSTKNSINKGPHGIIAIHNNLISGQAIALPWVLRPEYYEEYIRKGSKDIPTHYKVIEEMGYVESRIPFLNHDDMPFKGYFGFFDLDHYSDEIRFNTAHGGGIDPGNITLEALARMTSRIPRLSIDLGKTNIHDGVFSKVSSKPKKTYS